MPAARGTKKAHQRHTRLRSRYSPESPPRNRKNTTYNRWKLRIGCRRARLSKLGELSSATPAAVKTTPNKPSPPLSRRNGGSVPASAFRENHPSSSSGASTPTHSYHSQRETKKYERE